MRIIAESKEENELVKKAGKEYGASAVMRENAYAVTMWCAADVKEKHDDIDDDGAEAFLEAYERRLVESSISGGWDFIEYADVSDYKRSDKQCNGETHVSNKTISEVIVKKMIEDGLMAKAIVPKLEDGGLKAYIGEHWFYFGGSEFEFTDPKEIPFDVLVEEIKFVLDDFRSKPHFHDEYLYYFRYLCENI